MQDLVNARRNLNAFALLRFRSRPRVSTGTIPLPVASIDFLKSDRNKHLFLLNCPDLIMVDEAYGSASASERSQSQHQRHELVRAIAALEDWHLILLTGTPHRDIDSAFRSLLALLRRDCHAL
jgi:superfamily II DNA or RNA helicase